MNGMKQKVRIPTAVSKIKIASHDKDFVNIDFCILKILQS